jgi:DNA-directed RNA polymerase subunit F
MESASAEIAQRQNENVQLAEQFVEFEAERNAGEAREGLLQLESEQVRARLAEIDELLRNTRQQLDQRATAAVNFRPPPPSCNPTCNTWPTPA